MGNHKVGVNQCYVHKLKRKRLLISELQVNKPWIKREYLDGKGDRGRRVVIANKDMHNTLHS